MGNDFNLTKSCIGVSQLCTQQQNVEYIYQQSLNLKKKKAKSTDQIKQKIIKYIEKNRLQLYSVRQKKVLQTLVSVDQQHISDEIVQMDRKLKIYQQQKRQLSRKNFNEPLNNLNDNQNKWDEQAKQKLSKVTKQLFQLKQKRKKLFEQAQCLLLEDLDMIFQQIPNFDQNYHFVNDIFDSSKVINKQQQANLNGNEIGMTQSTNFNKTSIFNYYFASKLKTSTIHQQKDQKLQTFKSKLLHPLENRKEKKQQEKLKQVVKIEDKKKLKKQPQIASIGIDILRNNELLMIVPIECFSGIGALQNNNRTGLPSGASLLQILANKIKAVNMRRGCSLGVAFLVNEEYQQKLRQQISKTAGFENYDCGKVQIDSDIQNLSDANSQPINYNVVCFRNIWPSFNLQNKILLNQYDKGGLNFSTHDGDLIGFIQNSMQLKDLIQKYQYVNLTNINNMLSQIGDIYALGYLSFNQQLDIVAKVLRPQKDQNQLKNFFQLDEKGFINIVKKQIDNNKKSNPNEIQNQVSDYLKNKCNYTKNSSYLNTEEYYIRSRIFINDSGPLKRLLMSKITRYLDPKSDSQSIIFYLQRSLSSILFYRFSAFILIDEENEFSHVKTQQNNFFMNGQTGYSRYCKKLLGLKQSQIGKQQQQMVQIDAGILHKGSQQMIKILKQLRKVKQVGFPIILYSNFFNNKKQT